MAQGATQADKNLGDPQWKHVEIRMFMMVYTVVYKKHVVYKNHHIETCL